MLHLSEFSVAIEECVRTTGTELAGLGDGSLTVREGFARLGVGLAVAAGVYFVLLRPIVRRWRPE